MEAAWYLGGVVFVALGVALSIALHEVGHLLPAKKFGVRVTQYMIGFGPTLWSRRKGETEYGVKAIPLGGYISMIGMFPPNPDGGVRESSTGLFQSLAADARAQSAEQIGPEDRGRVFYALPVWKRLVIMLGGPVMNLLIAIVLFAVLLVGFGISQPTTKVATVSQCVIGADVAQRTGQTQCGPQDPVAPAAQAGIVPGDVVTAFNGAEVAGWDDLTSRIREHAGQEVELTVVRSGRSETLRITPLLTQRPVTDDMGVPVKDDDGGFVYRKVGFLGIGPTEELVRQPVSAVLPEVGRNIARVASVVVNLPQRMAAVAEAAFGSAERDPNGPMSVVGVGRVAGEVATLEAVPLWAKFATLLGLLASLNLALFVFNLVPLLPLDGGHVAGALWEGLRRKVARLRGAADPGPFDMARLLPLTYAVAVLLMGMGALLIYADIVKPVSLFAP